jgi:hypothetical protein
VPGADRVSNPASRDAGRWLFCHDAGTLFGTIMTDLFAGDCNPAAAARSPNIDTPVRKLAPHLEAVQRPFLDQSVSITSILAVGCHRLWAEDGDHGEGVGEVPADNDAMLLRLAADGDIGLAIVARIPISPSPDGLGGRRPHTLDSLARKAGELSNGDAGDRLILLPSRVLERLIVPLADAIDFRAVVILPSQESGQPGDAAAWKLQRALFDRGLVGIGCVQVAGGEARCFLASDAVRSLHRLGAGSRGQVTMSCLGKNGRFANQLFQYAYARLYALRHGVTAAVPAWAGKYLFDLDDPSCADLALPQLCFRGFIDDDRLLWNRDEPPIDIDLWGYFQEIPRCWRNHRPLLRRMFQLRAEHRHAIDAWHSEVTRGGRRTLVAVHVRRGDYRNHQQPDFPWFRLTPEDWYLAWLRAIWPTLSDPLLFVATDEPAVIRPIFKEFETISATFGASARLLPYHIRDFEILRRADYLAICNSSFSRMAAILADPTQKCFLPSFQRKAFVPYEPWIDDGFWARFA